MGRRQASRTNQASTYLVPRNTKGVLRTAEGKCLHLGLFLGRYTPQQVIVNEAWDNRGRKWRDHWLKQEVLPSFNTSSEALCDLQSAVYARWQQATAGAVTFQARNKGRLIVGMGGKGVLEVGITLHHVTGLPIIPGSALKGLTRTYALLDIAGKLGIRALKPKQLQQLQQAKLASPLEILDAALVTSDEQREDVLTQLTKLLAQKLNTWAPAQRYRAAFGSQEDSGDCLFYDAVVARLPASETLFELDVMTPHFKDYYDDVNSGNPTFEKAPHDGQNPNPIGFVTVAAGTTFAFAVGSRTGSDPQVAKWAAKYLKQALVELGVGAKTAAGYGVFEV